VSVLPLKNIYEFDLNKFFDKVKLQAVIDELIVIDLPP
jgi:hypothetical protein